MAHRPLRMFSGAHRVLIEGFGPHGKDGVVIETDDRAHARLIYETAIEQLPNETINLCWGARVVERHP